jgi:chromosome partitioning protein
MVYLKGEEDTVNMTAKKVSVINMKGGVGKTTLSINLGLFLSEFKNKKVLLIDLDPQANATILGMSPEELLNHKEHKKTIADLFINCFKQYGPFQKKETEKIILDQYVNRCKTVDENSFFDLIPSEIYLSSILRGLPLGPYELNKLLINEAEKKYDYILIDCAPTYSVLTTLALAATGSILIPVMADTFGINGVDLMKQVIEEHKLDYGQEIKIIGIVITMFDKNKTNQVRSSTEIIKLWGSDKTFKGKISKDEWYRVANGKRINLWNTSSPHTREFEDFVEEFISRTGAV